MNQEQLENELKRLLKLDPEIIKNKDRLKSRLLDFAPNSGREIERLIVILDLGIVDELKQNSLNKTDDNKKKQWFNNLLSKGITRENAQESINSWNKILQQAESSNKNFLKISTSIGVLVLIVGFVFYFGFYQDLKREDIKTTPKAPLKREDIKTTTFQKELIKRRESLMWQDNEDVENNKYEWKEAKDYCENIKLYGYNDWRLPSIPELVTTIDYTRGTTSTKTKFKYFSDSRYWSNNMNQDRDFFYVSAYDGSVNTDMRILDLSVRCVRGEQIKELQLIRDDSLDVVIDRKNHLMWQDNKYLQQNSSELNWNSAVNFCENLTLGRFNDWRLPSLEELITITDYSKKSSMLFRAFKFKHSGNFIYNYNWTSTKYIRIPSHVWVVDEIDGEINTNNKSDRNFVRCVRDLK